MKKILARVITFLITFFLYGGLGLLGAVALTFLLMICVVTVGIVFELSIPYKPVAFCVLVFSCAAVTITNIVWQRIQKRKAHIM